ncbi:phosphoribosylanthranilate isomerase [Marinomonas sp. THO17]|uniref:phosphoribosylanthranilate isomerase n=1 Tax=Marinomonas sp. THO17 TaxID=3149048 RepID=UPI00336BEF33
MNCRVKICGITNLDDAEVAVAAGADALGFVFYDKSPRYVSPDIANQIVANLPPFVVPVALFVDADKSLVEQVITANPRWMIQFHGREDEAECASYGRHYMKALRVKEGDDIERSVSQYTSASAILLDAYKKGVPGGTGETFNWSLIPDNLSKPIVLAGGLTPDNVRQAVSQVQPYAVDVSGGVELSKGRKDSQKVIEFIAGAKRG